MNSYSNSLVKKDEQHQICNSEDLNYSFSPSPSPKNCPWNLLVLLVSEYLVKGTRYKITGIRAKTKTGKKSLRKKKNPITGLKIVKPL